MNPRDPNTNVKNKWAIYKIQVRYEALCLRDTCFPPVFIVFADANQAKEN